MTCTPCGVAWVIGPGEWHIIVCLICLSGTCVYGLQPAHVLNVSSMRFSRYTYKIPLQWHHSLDIQSSSITSVLLEGFGVQFPYQHLVKPLSCSSTLSLGTMSIQSLWTPTHPERDWVKQDPGWVSMVAGVYSYSDWLALGCWHASLRIWNTISGNHLHYFMPIWSWQITPTVQVFLEQTNQAHTMTTI